MRIHQYKHASRAWRAGTPQDTVEKLQRPVLPTLSLYDPQVRGGSENSIQEFSPVMTSLPSGLLQKPLIEMQSIFNQNMLPNPKVPGENEGLNYRLWPQEETVQ